MYYWNNRVTITREDLYKLVWEKSMVQVAADYGVSDVALAKLCKRLNVPRPYLGYWAKLQNGKKVKQTPLPKAGKDDPISGSLPKRPPREEPKERNPLISAQIEFENANRIKVQTELEQPHPLLQRVMDAYSTATTGKDGFLHCRRKAPQDLRFSEATKRRAFLVLDSLLKALEVRSMRTSLNECFQVDTPAGPIEFTLEEPCKKVKREPTRKEIAAQASMTPWTREHTHYYDLVPSGSLNLRITSEAITPDWRNWTDGRRSLEGQLNSFILGIVRFAENRQIELDRREAQRLKWEEEARLEAERRKFWMEEKERRKVLWEEIDAWTKSEQILRYAEAIEAAHPTDDKVKERLTWMRNYAEELNPILSEEEEDDEDDEDEAISAFGAF